MRKSTLFFALVYCFSFIFNCAFATKLIVVNKSSGSISIFDEKSLTRIKDIPVGFHPHESAVTPDHNYAVVPNYGTMFKPGSTISVVDLSRGTVAKTISLVEGSRPHGVVVLSNERALVTAEGIQSLLVIDLTLGRVSKAIRLPGVGAHLLIVDAEKHYAYVASPGSGTISKINLKNYNIVMSRDVGRSAEGIAMTVDEQLLLITNRKNNEVTVLKAKDLSDYKKIPTQKGPIRIAVFDHGRKAVFTNTVSGTMQIIDLASLEIVGTYRTSPSYSFSHGKIPGCLLSVPVTIAVRKDQKTAYIANSFAGNVALVDLFTGKILNTLRAGKEPDGLTIMEERV